MRQAKISATPKSVHAKSPEVTALIGEVAPYVKPSAPASQPKNNGRSTGQNAQRKRALRESGGAKNQQSTRPGSKSHSQGAAGRRRRQNSR